MHSITLHIFLNKKKSKYYFNKPIFVLQINPRVNKSIPPSFLIFKQTPKINLGIFVKLFSNKIKAFKIIWPKPYFFYLAKPFSLLSTLFPLSFPSFLSLFLFWKIGENSQIRIRPWGPFWHLYLFPSNPPAGPFSFSLAQHPFTLVSLPSGSRGEPTHMVPSPCHATSTFFPSYKASLGAPATLAPLPSPSQPPPALSLSPLPLFFPLPRRPWPSL